jgi:hypothetical protein
MRHPLRLTALCAALLLGCGSDRAPVFTDGDAAAPDAAGRCASNAQCDDGVACTRDLCLVGGVCEHTPDSPSCMPARRCMRAADCDDRVACTRDTCLVDGTCANTPQSDQCPAGQTCDATRGCGGATPGTCRSDADCRDAFDCTIDACGSDGRCVYTAQNARCAAGQVCRVGMGCLSERACSRDADCDDRMRCNGVERCAELACIAGAPPNCDDMNACTMDACVETGPTMCAHTMNPTCAGMVRSGIFNVAMPGSFSCAAGQVQVSVMQLLFSVSGSTVTVTPTPRGPAMMGTIAGNTFTVRVTIGTPSIFECAETYQLTGTFTDANRFTGTYSISFAPPETCGLYGCVPHSFPVTGIAAM